MCMGIGQCISFLRAEKAILVHKLFLSYVLVLSELNISSSGRTSKIGFVINTNIKRPCYFLL